MEAPTGHDLNADQIAYWNGPGDQQWTDRQQHQDVLLAPISDILIDRARAKAGERIIDVGCGCGRRQSRWRKKSVQPDTSSASTSRPRCWLAPGRSRLPACRSIS